MTQLLTDLTSMIAIDLVNDLSPSEVQHMKRELGPNWKEQLLTPVMQPITLRSGTVLKLTGGNATSCRWAEPDLVRSELQELFYTAIYSTLYHNVGGKSNGFFRYML